MANEHGYPNYNVMEMAGFTFIYTVEAQAMLHVMLENQARILAKLEGLPEAEVLDGMKDRVQEVRERIRLAMVEAEIKHAK